MTNTPPLAMRPQIVRRADVIAMTVVYLTIVQLAIGWVTITTVMGQAPSQEVINASMEFRQQGLEGRLIAIEHLRLDTRLALLEASAVELAQVKLLIYGVFVTLFGSLLAQIIQIRGQRRGRQGADDAP